MTRINCVPVQELSRLHLLAEYKELPRVFKLARRVPNPPREYVLGRGHVTFFYDKLGYCEKRFYQLVREMNARGYRTQFTSPPDVDKPDLWGDWVPDERAINLNRQRIAERINKMEDIFYD